MDRNEASDILDKLERQVAARAKALPNEQFWAWFSGEGREVVENICDEDREYVSDRIDSMLTSAGKIPAE